MRILLLAGEESGELYASRLREILKEHEIRGYGDYGFAISDLAVMGLGQVLCKILFFLRVRRTMERAIEDWKPDVVCTIDYPGMNLRLAAYAKARGIRAVHVVCPQVWAWKQGRIPRIEAAVDCLCCFFPFEPALFRPGIATFVGHPLVDEFASLRRAVERPAEDRLTLALLPGSRIGEIKKILPVLISTVERLRADGLAFHVEIPAANDRAEACIRRLLAAREGFRVTSGGARALLLRADCAIVASGTATLEAALARCPTLLVYRVGWFFAFLARRVIRGVRHIGLANVIWEKCRPDAAASDAPMPELLQEDFTAEKLGIAVRPLLVSAEARTAATARLEEAMQLLHSPGKALARVADEVTSLRATSDF